MSRIFIRQQFILVSLCFILCCNLYSQRNPMWAVPVATNYVPNFYQVDSGLYRCAQPHKQAFAELSEMGIATIVNLRYFETDKRKAQKTDLQLVHIKMRASKCKDDEIVAALRLIKNRQGAILIHCKHGADRTGLVIALYRIVFQGWSKEDAIKELEQGGYNFHSVFSNIPQYIRDLDVERMKREINH
jgi:protein tyrosine/serine phosphatase